MSNFITEGNNYCETLKAYNLTYACSISIIFTPFESPKKTLQNYWFSLKCSKFANFAKITHLYIVHGFFSKFANFGLNKNSKSKHIVWKPYQRATECMF